MIGTSSRHAGQRHHRDGGANKSSDVIPRIRSHNTLPTLADTCRHSTSRNAASACRLSKSANMRLVPDNVGCSSVLPVLRKSWGLSVRHNPRTDRGDDHLPADAANQAHHLVAGVGFRQKGKGQRRRPSGLLLAIKERERRHGLLERVHFKVGVKWNQTKRNRRSMFNETMETRCSNLVRFLSVLGLAAWARGHGRPPRHRRG